MRFQAETDIQHSGTIGAHVDPVCSRVRHDAAAKMRAIKRSTFHEKDDSIALRHRAHIAVRERILKERLAEIRTFLEPLSEAEQESLFTLPHKVLSFLETSDMERRALCRLCDNRVCKNCPIPADF